ncbi:MAG: HEAT repeat domain-containing protein [Bdellovibrionia bacterium]
MKFAVVVLAAIAAGEFSNAALPKQPQVQPQVDSALQRGSSARLKALRSTGPKAYTELRAVAFDPEKPYQIRWRALMSLAWMGQKESLKDLEVAIASKDWFMRDGALLAIAKVDPNLGVKHARKLLKDAALVVRTTAVKVIRKANDLDSEHLLWEELYKKINFRGNQSLWVRRHIVETLADFSSAGTERKFADILDDTDASLHPPAMRALEKLTGKHPGRESRLFWKTWAKNNFQ